MYSGLWYSGRTRHSHCRDGGSIPPRSKTWRVARVAAPHYISKCGVKMDRIFKQIGELAEWTKATVSKTVVPETGPEVRILYSPPAILI